MDDARQKYGTDVLDRIINVYTFGESEPIHVAYMVTRAGALPPVGPFFTIGEAEAQAKADKHAERKHNREVEIGGA